VLDEEAVRRDLRHAADKAHQENAPAPSQRRQRRIKQRAADRIEADIRASAFS